MAGVIAIGRWQLIASGGVPPWSLVAAVAVLLPSVIINLIVLTKRTANTGTAARVAETATFPSPKSLPRASAG
jgi:hypothetical protein